METIKKKAKITHQSPTIQYNDKAIKELKWIKKSNDLHNGKKNTI
jgi:hypothetical protein